jgi:hypothetical protein
VGSRNGEQWKEREEYNHIRARPTGHVSKQWEELAMTGRTVGIFFLFGYGHCIF